MSNEAHKADQIAYRYYTKLVSVVHAARTTADPNPQAKVDKWVRNHPYRTYHPLALTG
jgi:autophagy-related protein 13